MINKRAVFIFFSIVIILGFLTWWELYSLRQDTKSSLKTFLARTLQEKSLDAREDHLDFKPFGYNLYSMYCPDETSQVKAALGFSAERFILIHFQLDQSRVLTHASVEMEGFYERDAYGLKLMADNRALILPFRLKMEKDFYTSFLDFYGEYLHPRYCGEVRDELGKLLEKMVEHYPEVKKGAPLKRPEIWKVLSTEL